MQYNNCCALQYNSSLISKSRGSYRFVLKVKIAYWTSGGERAENYGITVSSRGGHPKIRQKVCTKNALIWVTFTLGTVTSCSNAPAGPSRLITINPCRNGRTQSIYQQPTILIGAIRHSFPMALFDLTKLSAGILSLSL